jgi:dihydroflavonol-4-reductase
MNILLTGASGFLGSHLCRRLAADGHTVTVLHRSTSNLAPLKDLHVRHEVGEITDAADVDRATRDQEIVIHAAAAMISTCTTRDVVYKVNVEGTRNVVQGCLRNGVRRLLHVSSVAAIGIPDEPMKPANENFVFNLASSGLHYHISKFKAEAAVREGIGQGLDAVIVNPTGLHGPAAVFYRGGDIVKYVRQNRILRYSSGGVCVVHVEDVVNGLMSALHQGITGNRYILGGENLSFLQMMQKAASALQLKRIYLAIPAAASKLSASAAASMMAFRRNSFSSAYANYYCSSRWSFYDSSKARRAFGFDARPYEVILDESIRFVGAKSA